MIKVEVGNKEYELLNKWEEINLSLYSEIMEIFKLDETSYINKTIKVINILSGISIKNIMKMNIADFNKIQDELKFITTEIDGIDIDMITISGEDYYIKKDFNKLTVGESISLEVIDKDNLPMMLTVFLRKKVDGKLEDFDTDFVEEREEIFKNIIITDVYNMFKSFINGERV